MSVDTQLLSAKGVGLDQSWYQYQWQVCSWRFRRRNGLKFWINRCLLTLHFSHVQCYRNATRRGAAAKILSHGPGYGGHLSRACQGLLEKGGSGSNRLLARDRNRTNFVEALIVGRSCLFTCGGDDSNAPRPSQNFVPLARPLHACV